MERRENEQKLAKNVCIIFSRMGRREKKPPCIKLKHPEWQKGELGNTRNALFSYPSVLSHSVQLKLSVVERRTQPKECLVLYQGSISSLVELVRSAVKATEGMYKTHLRFQLLLGLLGWVWCLARSSDLPLEVCRDEKEEKFSQNELLLAQNSPNGFAFCIWYPSVQTFTIKVMALQSTDEK